jgi:RND family efflux transporter MFP subunit
MDDRASLLDALKIERSDEGRSGLGRRGWIVCAVLLAIGAIAGGWFVWGATTALAVGAATAEAADVATAAGPASVLDASGYVIARRQATVSAKITGKVASIEIEEGQRVERDQILARLDDANARAAVAQAAAELDRANALLKAAEIAHANAVPIFRRQREQFERAFLSAQEFDSGKASFEAAAASMDVARQSVRVAQTNRALAERNLEDTIVRAPFAGVVTVKAAQEGEMISPVSAGGGFTRTGIGTIVDMDSLEIEVDVSENYINRVHADQGVTARLNAYPNVDVPARVIAIIPTADRAKATVRVRIALLDKDPRILPQMGVRVAFHGDDSDATDASRASSAVTVPSTAVQADGETGVVFLIRDDVIERRAVRLGRREGDAWIVLSGLTPGARVAIGDFAQLVDGARVRIEP